MGRSVGPPVALPPVLAFILGVPVAPREAVERTIQAAIEALDLMDGDADIEANGDELDGSLGEDDFHRQSPDPGAGCPVSDPDLEHDGREPLDYEEGAFADTQAYRFHVQRLRLTRCLPKVVREPDWYSRQFIQRQVGHRLVREPVTPKRRQVMMRKRGVPKRPRA